MAQIKKGSKVRAYLDPLYVGTVLEVVSENPREMTASGPMSAQLFCIVELSTGKIVKTKITDLYIDY